MESFNQLLNAYVRRAGISDTELARALGVSRQTIFRWREGLTGRPRQREDVLTIARKLRLTPEEQDRLLLAAGFRPEKGDLLESSRAPAALGTSSGLGLDTAGWSEVQPEGEVTPVGAVAPVEERQDRAGEKEVEEMIATPSSPPSRSRLILSTRRQKLLLVLGGLLLLALAVGLFRQGAVEWPATPAPAGGFSASSLAPPVGDSSPRPAAPAVTPAAPGETLLLVTHFANYAGSQVGYNVAGRLAQALQREIDQTRLAGVRVAIWPQPTGERSEALRAGQTVSATLVIYGEYDVGRVVVAFAQPADQTAFIDPALQQHVADLQELSATINSDLPQQVRSLALLALGQIYLNRREMDQARPLLTQARDYLQADPQVDQPTLALANFYLGIAYQHSQPPQLDEAIQAYTQAIDAWPEMISSRLNRSAAYVSRRRPGDLEQALVDAREVITAVPNWAVAYNNRGSVHLAIGGTKNLELALADLDQAISIDSTQPEAYLNRAYVRFQQGRPMTQITPDLEAALALRPDYALALNLFCWGYALEQQPEQALPYCQQAIAADPQPVFLDSRGVAYALSGDYPAAIADFQAYITWLEQQPDETQQPALAQRQAWIKALEAGQNPFTPAVLAELRQE